MSKDVAPGMLLIIDGKLGLVEDVHIYCRDLIRVEFPDPKHILEIQLGQIVECGCSCHKTPGKMHCVPCCNAFCSICKRGFIRGIELHNRIWHYR